MKKLLRVNPGFYAVAGLLALLVAGVFTGGFGRTEANGSII
jgi:hypothetical protein